MKSWVTAAVLLHFLAGPAGATPISYIESVSGDLAGFPTAAFQFGEGENTISGSTGVHIGTCPHSICADFDSFSFTVAAGSAVTAISFTYTLDAIESNTASSAWVLCSGLPPDQPACVQNLLAVSHVDHFAAPPGPNVFATLALPLGEGTYTILEDSLGFFPSGPQGAWLADYTWTFDVVTIPEPSSGSLVALALVLLAFGANGPQQVARPHFAQLMR